jgi:hypothetical protein
MIYKNVSRGLLYYWRFSVIITTLAIIALLVYGLVLVASYDFCPLYYGVKCL